MPRTKLQSNLTFPAVPQEIRPDLYGVTWGLKEMAKELHRDANFVSQEVLKPNRMMLDVSKGGPVRYPTKTNNQVSNAPYRIQARSMAYWIELNWSQIQGDRS